jgi:hypothetical protein
MLAISPAWLQRKRWEGAPPCLSGTAAPFAMSSPQSKMDRFAIEKGCPMDEMQMGSARATISNVIATYNNCGDRGMIDELLSVFAADALYELPDLRMEGRDAIRAYLLGIIERSRSTANPDEKSTNATSRLFGSRHHLTTSRIEFRGSDGMDLFLRDAPRRHLPGRPLHRPVPEDARRLADRLPPGEDALDR